MPIINDSVTECKFSYTSNTGQNFRTFRPHTCLLLLLEYAAGPTGGINAAGPKCLDTNLTPVISVNKQHTRTMVKCTITKWLSPENSWDNFTLNGTKCSHLSMSMSSHGHYR